MKRWKRLLLLISIPLLLLAGWLLSLTLYDAWHKYRLRQRVEAYADQIRPSASPQVQIIPDSALPVQLRRGVGLRLYLPRGYSADTQHYPVMYFFDGQSLFDDAVLQGPEWRIDEVLDSLGRLGELVPIVVGIDAGPYRQRAYQPFLLPQPAADTLQNGRNTLSWLAQELKPWVDSTFRTNSDVASTSIGGASLGGLMAYVGMMRYPETFGKAYAFSPSFWVDGEVFRLHRDLPGFQGKRLYINAGEHQDVTHYTDKMHRILLASGWPPDQIRYEVVPDGYHWHPTWRQGFLAAYPWMEQ